MGVTHRAESERMAEEARWIGQGGKVVPGPDGAGETGHISTPPQVHPDSTEPARGAGEGEDGVARKPTGSTPDTDTVPQPETPALSPVDEDAYRDAERHRAEDVARTQTREWREMESERRRQESGGWGW